MKCNNTRPWQKKPQPVVDRFLAAFFAVMALFIISHSYPAAVALLLCAILLAFPRAVQSRFLRSPSAPSVARVLVIATAFLLVCKPYPMPISIRQILEVDEGEGYRTRYFEVFYYAPYTPTVIVRADSPDQEASTRTVYGYARYSPIDFWMMSHNRVIRVQNLKAGVDVVASKGGRS